MVMTCEIAIPPQEKTTFKSSPVVRSYDTGFEHGVEHMLTVRQLVEEADAEPLIAKPETILRGISAA
jgi:hypothetical protein